jgi:hypothetical protein
MRTPGPLFCPSAPAAEEAILLGIANPDGLLAFVTPPHKVDRELLRRLGPDSEARFRFAQPCVETGCKNWTGNNCGLIAGLTSGQDASPRRDDLPACSIRSHCRWFDERGPDACAVCPRVRFPVTTSLAAQPEPSSPG